MLGKSLGPKKSEILLCAPCMCAHAAAGQLLRAQHVFPAAHRISGAPSEAAPTPSAAAGTLTAALSVAGAMRDAGPALAAGSTAMAGPAPRSRSAFRIQHAFLVVVFGRWWTIRVTCSCCPVLRVCLFCEHRPRCRILGVVRLIRATKMLVNLGLHGGHCEAC